MEQCELGQLTGNTCENDAYANITINSTNGEATINICESHLNQLIGQAESANLGPEAQRQANGQAANW
jgi:hypothetical protein